MILALSGLGPRAETEFGSARRFVGQSSEWSFDFVPAQNAPNHAMGPLRCIRQIAVLTKPGGWIVIDYTEREADHQNFQSLHQWDFEVAEGQYRIEDARCQVWVIDHDGCGFTILFNQYGRRSMQLSRFYCHRRRD